MAVPSAPVEETGCSVAPLLAVTWPLTIQVSNAISEKLPEIGSS